MFDKLLNLNIKICPELKLRALFRQTLSVVIFHTQITQELMSRCGNNGIYPTSESECLSNSSNKIDERWCTITESSKKSGYAKAVISRWATEGIIHSNGIKGPKRLIYFPDVYYMAFKAEQKELAKEEYKSKLYARKIPNKH